jgi:hypothetical protein
MITLSAPTSTVPLPYTERALDPVTGDLLIPYALITGAPAIVQRIYCRFRFWLGEYFLDTSQGVPWRTRIFVSNPNYVVISSLMAEVISGTPGVGSVLSCRTVLVDAVARRAQCDWSATLANGSVVTAVDQPFIVT